MARSGVSQADQALIEALAGRGLEATPFQLERWRHMGLLPRTTRRGLGQGLGSTSAYPGGTLDLAAAIAGEMKQGRPSQLVALSLFAMRLPVPEATVRRAFLWTIESKPRHRIGTTLKGADDVFRQAERRARRVPTRYAPLLSHYVNPERLSPRRAREHVRRSRDLRRLVELIDVVHGAGYEELSDESLIDVLRITGFLTPRSASDLLIAKRKRELEEEEPVEGLRGTPGQFWTRMLNRISFAELCQARDAGLRVGTANAMLALYAMVDGEAAQLAEQFDADPEMAWLRFMPHAAPHYPQWIVGATLPLLGQKTLLAVVDRYASLVMERTPTWMERFLEQSEGNPL